MATQEQINAELKATSDDLRDARRHLEAAYARLRSGYIEGTWQAQRDTQEAIDRVRYAQDTLLLIIQR